MIFSVIAIIIMGYICSWPNAKTLGKQNLSVSSTAKEVEMADVEEKDGENDATPTTVSVSVHSNVSETPLSVPANVDEIVVSEPTTTDQPSA